MKTKARDYKPDTFKLQELVSKGIPMKKREEVPTPPSQEVEPVSRNDEIAESSKTVERTKRKTAPKGDYESLFLISKEFKERRAVYLSRDKHQEISYILKMIDNGDVSVGAFVENIINYHLEMFREDIDALYEKKCTKPSERFKK